MRKCCCCGVKAATILLGVVNFVGSVMILVPLSGYLANSETEVLNVIQKHDKHLEIVLEDILKEHNWTMYSYPDIMEQVRAAWPTVALVSAVLAAVCATCSGLLVVGVVARVRHLLLPFLVLTMVDIVVAGGLGVVVVVALFWSSYIPGIVSLVVYVVVAVLSLYSWASVLATYKLLSAETSGAGGYFYSPASPVKPTSYGNGDYYPSAPQRFVMEDYRERKDVQ